MPVRIVYASALGALIFGEPKAEEVSSSSVSPVGNPWGKKGNPVPFPSSLRPKKAYISEAYIKCETAWSMLILSLAIIPLSSYIRHFVQLQGREPTRSPNESIVPSTSFGYSSTIRSPSLPSETLAEVLGSSAAAKEITSLRNILKLSGFCCNLISFNWHREGEFDVLGYGFFCIGRTYTTMDLPDAWRTEAHGINDSG